MLPMERLSFGTEYFRRGLTRRFGLIPLPAQPFNHLSAFAYLAIGVVVLASSLVAGYLVYSCYHSAKSKVVEQGPTERNGRDAELGIDEKDKVEKRIELEHFEELDQPSEDKCNVNNIRASYSQTFFENGRNVAFDPANCPQLAHTSGRSTTFHLPPPPSSPSPAHIRRHPGESSSPVPPSPSLFPDDTRPDVLPGGESYLDGKHPMPGRHIGTKYTGKEHPNTEVDSNRMRYSPNSFITDSTVKLYKESFPVQNGSRNLTGSTGRRSGESEIIIENVNPIFNQSSYKSKWENVVPPPRLRPGPGYF